MEAKKNNPDAKFEDSLKARIQAFGGEEALPWIYRNDIEDVWKAYLREQAVPNGVH